jgi:hypothetical protein
MEPVVWKKIAYALKQDLVADLEISSVGEVRSVVSKRVFSVHVKDNQKHFERRANRIGLRHALTETFLGPIGADEEIEFIDGDKMNCVISNLRYRPKVRRADREAEETTNQVIIPPIAPMTLDNRLMRMEAKMIELTCSMSDLDNKLDDIQSDVNTKLTSLFSCMCDNEEMLLALVNRLIPDWKPATSKDRSRVNIIITPAENQGGRGSEGTGEGPAGDA